MELVPFKSSGGDADGSKCVRVVLRGGGNDADAMTVMVMPDTPIKTIKQCYSQRYNLDLNGLKFLHDGERLNQDSMMVQELDPEDGKYWIDVVQHQEGGGHHLVKC